MIEEEVTPFGFINNGIDNEKTFVDSTGQIWQENEEYSKSSFL